MRGASTRISIGWSSNYGFKPLKGNVTLKRWQQCQIPWLYQTATAAVVCRSPKVRLCLTSSDLLYANVFHRLGAQDRQQTHLRVLCSAFVSPAVRSGTPPSIRHSPRFNAFETDHLQCTYVDPDARPRTGSERRGALIREVKRETSDVRRISMLS
jgi:hypothetical protein